MEVTIEKLIYGGDGLARQEGATVFVPYVLPRERVEADPVERKKNFVHARLGQILDSSPERIAPRCAYFGQCGGCHYQHIPCDRQLAYKVEILRETLRRIGKIDWTRDIPAHASPEWGYRNRAQWKIRPLGPNAAPRPRANFQDANLGIGYFRPNSASLCAVDDCAVLAPPLLAALQGLRAAILAGSLPASLREIETFAHTAESGGESRLLLTANFAGFPPRLEECAAEFHRAVPGLASLVLYDVRGDDMKLDGPGFIDYEAGGTRFRVGHFSFFQVNRFLAAELARAAVQAGASGGKLALDLFAGVGLFSLPLARQFDRVIAVESNPAAARDLEANARGVGAIEVRSSEAHQFLARLKETPDLVVVDPPRSGLEPEWIARLAKIAPRKITYVSCEPPTLARDLAALIRSGYAVKSFELFDLFPQTFHMETVTQLEKP
ncbi:MAG TPA: 23S rRNA (uracil(1939)-C(5))-methyltransferase RlmD [Verrucomicrobiae bacterium]|nr:23S rRNA (uracil(1939)-C(5))-methyltransferase RlmD [Verrucomicrobiae bacterium]